MRYALAFIASFAVLAGATAFVRVQAAEPPATQAEPQKEDQKKEEKEEKKDGHDMGGKKDDAKEEQPEWGGEVKTDLKNAKDPVTGKEIAERADHHVVYRGFKIRFEGESTLKRFKRRPVQYFVPLGLELTAKREVKKVNPEDFKDPPVIPATCPFMGGDIIKEDGVYMFHRGYRIYFCCWNGCWEDFLKDPAKHYGEYGLNEQDGKLVPKES
jgi:YHS domain-containing protein